MPDGKLTRSGRITRDSENARIRPMRAGSPLLGDVAATVEVFDRRARSNTHLREGRFWPVSR